LLNIKKIPTRSLLFESFSFIRLSPLSDIVDLIIEFFVKLCNDGANLYFFIQTSQRQSPRWRIFVERGDDELTDDGDDDETWFV
jgi:hypothetical protein